VFDSPTIIAKLSFKRFLIRLRLDGRKVSTH
jgi:hypothetical protein